MYGVTVDTQYVSKEITSYLNDANIHNDIIQLIISKHVAGEEVLTSSTPNILFQQIAVPYEHFGTGSVERLIRTCREANWKKTAADPTYDPRLWAKLVTDTIDIINMLPTVHHPDSSPYLMFDRHTVDVLKTPFLPFGSTVIAHIPNVLQNTVSGRGFEAIVTGRLDATTGGIRLWNVKSKRELTRATMKFLGEHPVKGLLFESPIHIEIANGSDIPKQVTFTLPSPLTPPSIPLIASEKGVPEPVIQSEPEPATEPAAEPESTVEALHYVIPHEKNIRKDTRPFWSKVGRTFAEYEENGAFSGLYKIVDVVTTVEHPRTFYYKYYNVRKPMPDSDDEFEYSLCTMVLTGGWADFAEGQKIAHAISRSRKLNIPTSWHEMMAHPEKEFYLPAFMIERN